MNATQQREYWLKVERLRRQLDIKYSSLFNAAIRKDLKQFASDLKNLVQEVHCQKWVAMLGVRT